MRAKRIIVFTLLTVLLFTFCACDNNVHTHVYSQTKFDRVNHWEECACGDKTQILNHEIADNKCSGCGWECVYTVDKNDLNVIYFGSYPQSEVIDENTVSELSTLAGNPIENLDGWTSFNYYVNDTVSDCMYYKDVLFGGEKFRGVYIKNYRPSWTFALSESANSYQDDNGYFISNAYWFKYEPIKWEIVSEIDGSLTLLSALALDSQQKDIDTAKDFVTNYAKSQIRVWLNSYFYTCAFSIKEQEIISTVEVDNSAKTTGLDNNKYACENTFDKVFLLSYTEMREYFDSDVEREKQSTDYAKSQGILVSDGNFDGNVCWWLRSPTGWHKDSDWHVTAEGHYDYYFHGVNSSSCGVVPAIKIIV